MAPVTRGMCQLWELTEYDPIRMRARYTIDQLADFHEAMAEETENQIRYDEANDPKKTT